MIIFILVSILPQFSPQISASHYLSLLWSPGSKRKVDRPWHINRLDRSLSYVVITYRIRINRIISFFLSLSLIYIYLHSGNEKRMIYIIFRYFFDCYLREIVIKDIDQHYNKQCSWSCWVYTFQYYSINNKILQIIKITYLL